MPRATSVIVRDRCARRHDAHLARREPGTGQERAEAIGGIVMHARQHVGEIGDRVDATRFARGHDRVEPCAMFVPASTSPTKRKILLPGASGRRGAGARAGAPAFARIHRPRRAAHDPRSRQRRHSRRPSLTSFPVRTQRRPRPYTRDRGVRTNGAAHADAHGARPHAPEPESHDAGKRKRRDIVSALSSRCRTTLR